mmetsp:Transcript_10408/g.20979  ORF Transcript_10408/g.20979 Transcript_10408/m.20979 type:complete len:1108 (-) Transcript_10408:2723-6046(-)
MEHDGDLASVVDLGRYRKQRVGSWDRDLLAEVEQWLRERSWRHVEKVLDSLVGEASRDDGVLEALARSWLPRFPKLYLMALFGGDGVSELNGDSGRSLKPPSNVWDSRDALLTLSRLFRLASEFCNVQGGAIALASMVKAAAAISIGTLRPNDEEGHPSKQLQALRSAQDMVIASASLLIDHLVQSDSSVLDNAASLLEMRVKTLLAAFLNARDVSTKMSLILLIKTLYKRAMKKDAPISERFRNEVDIFMDHYGWNQNFRRLTPKEPSVRSFVFDSLSSLPGSPALVMTANCEIQNGSEQVRNTWVDWSMHYFSFRDSERKKVIVEYFGINKSYFEKENLRVELAYTDPSNGETTNYSIRFSSDEQFEGFQRIIRTRLERAKGNSRKESVTPGIVLTVEPSSESNEVGVDTPPLKVRKIWASETLNIGEHEDSLPHIDSSPDQEAASQGFNQPPVAPTGNLLDSEHDHESDDVKDGDYIPTPARRNTRVGSLSQRKKRSIRKLGDVRPHRTPILPKETSAATGRPLSTLCSPTTPMAAPHRKDHPDTASMLIGEDVDPNVDASVKVHGGNTEEDDIAFFDIGEMLTSARKEVESREMSARKATTHRNANKRAKDNLGSSLAPDSLSTPTKNPCTKVPRDCDVPPKLLNASASRTVETGGSPKTRAGSIDTRIAEQITVDEEKLHSSRKQAAPLNSNSLVNPKTLMPNQPSLNSGDLTDGLNAAKGSALDVQNLIDHQLKSLDLQVMPTINIPSSPPPTSHAAEKTSFQLSNPQGPSQRREELLVRKLLHSFGALESEELHSLVGKPVSSRETRDALDVERSIDNIEVLLRNFHDKDNSIPRIVNDSVVEARNYNQQELDIDEDLLRLFRSTETQSFGRFLGGTKENAVPAPSSSPPIARSRNGSHTPIFAPNDPRQSRSDPILAKGERASYNRSAAHDVEMPTSLEHSIRIARWVVGHHEVLYQNELRDVLNHKKKNFTECFGTTETKFKSRIQNVFNSELCSKFKEEISSMRVESPTYQLKVLVKTSGTSSIKEVLKEVSKLQARDSSHIRETIHAVFDKEIKDINQKADILVRDADRSVHRLTRVDKLVKDLSNLLSLAPTNKM